MPEDKFSPEEEEWLKRQFGELDKIREKHTPEEYRGIPIYYKLDENKKPVPCNSYEFAMQCEQFEKFKRVAKTQCGPYVVSTVFLCIDHGFGQSEKPVLFETMIWSDKKADKEGEFFEHQWRYHTWQEAVEGHEAIVKLIEEGLLP
jgi:hypothetical protein